MATRQYIGARYVIKIYENSQTVGSAEWEANTSYEPLTMVTYQNSSYLSKKAVPATVGNPAANGDYWVVTGAYNGQIAELQNRVSAVENTIYNNIGVYPEDYGAIGNGVTDDIAAFNAAISTGYPLILKDGITYALGGLNLFNGYTDIIIISEGKSTLKSLDTTYHPTESLDQRQNAFINIKNANKVILKGIKFDGNQSYTERPLTESGAAWDNYIAVRDKTLGNVHIEESSNIDIEDCEFAAGLQGITMYTCTDFIIKNCLLHEQIADSLYIVDGCKRGEIYNCHSYHNGDDTYCLNSHGGSDYDYNENIAFFNCTGNDLNGALCFTNNSKNCSFNNCSGSVRRSGGLMVGMMDYSVYGKVSEGEFNNCTVECKNQNYARILTGLAGDKNYVHKIIYNNCKFYSSNKVVLSLLRVAGAIFNNCIFDGVGLEVYESNKTTFNECIMNLVKNIITLTCDELKINNCKIINNGTVSDTEHGASYSPTSNRCNINIYNTNCVALGNEYVNASGETPYYNIIVDGYNAANHEMDFDCDNIWCPNNQIEKINLRKTINLSTSSFGAIANQLTDGSLFVDTNNNLKTIVNGTVKTFTVT